MTYFEDRMTYFEKELDRVYATGRTDIFVSEGLIHVTLAKGRVSDHLQFRINGKRISRAEAQQLAEKYIEGSKRLRKALDREVRGIS